MDKLSTWLMALIPGCSLSGVMLGISIEQLSNPTKMHNKILPSTWGFLLTMVILFLFLKVMSLHKESEKLKNQISTLKKSEMA